jgi:hypothetical protein
MARVVPTRSKFEDLNARPTTVASEDYTSGQTEVASIVRETLLQPALESAPVILRSAVLNKLATMIDWIALPIAEMKP